MSRDAPKRTNLTAQQSQERILVILARNKGMPTKFSTIAQAYRDFAGDDDCTRDETIKLRCRTLLNQGLAVIVGGVDESALYRLTPLGVDYLPEESRPTPAQLRAGDIGAQVAAIRAQQHRVSLADAIAQTRRADADACLLKDVKPKPKTRSGKKPAKAAA